MMLLVITVDVGSSLVESSPATMLIKVRLASRIRAIIVCEITELGRKTYFLQDRSIFV